MRSPLEYEPDLIAGVGLVTVRWAALEHELADLFARLLVIPPAADQAYYAISNFSQRVDLIERALIASLGDQLARDVARALFAKIRRLWGTRNSLVHSHYAYVGLDWQGKHVSSVSGIGLSDDLTRHPMNDVLAPLRVYDGEGMEHKQPKVAHHGFAYQRRLQSGPAKWTIVNRGTFENHARQVGKRARQVRKFTIAIRAKAAPLCTGTFFESSPNTRSPRSLRNQGRVPTTQDS